MIPESIFVMCGLVVSNFWDMKKESKYNKNSKRQAECSCSIPEKDITNLASRAAQEGKGTQSSNLAMAAQTGIKTAKCCSRISVPPDGNSVDGYEIVMITTLNHGSHLQIMKTSYDYNLQ